MAIIAPTITAFDPHEYREQIERVEPFAKRLHIDLMDGLFTHTKSPGLKHIWWPHNIVAEIHLMYQEPMSFLDQLIVLKPATVIIHAEAELDHMHFVATLHKEGIEAGLALLQQTTVESVERIINSFDQVLIFSGHLGHHGGQADLKLLEKIKVIREYHPETKIAWDGGVNEENARQLIAGGVDILNVGGFIQAATDPKAAYDKLLTVVKE